MPLAPPDPSLPAQCAPPHPSAHRSHTTAVARVPVIGAGLRVGPDVLLYLPDIGAVCVERDQPHLSTAHRTQQREHLADVGDLRCPQLVCWAFD